MTDTFHGSYHAVAADRIVQTLEDGGFPRDRAAGDPDLH